MSRPRKHPVRIREEAPAPPRVLIRDRRNEHARGPQSQLPLGEAVPVPRAAPAATPSRRLWFCVHLPRLSLDACGRRDGPLAVVEDRHGVHRVLLANAAAAAAGIVPGQAVNAALALEPDIEVAERSVVQEQRAVESLAAWLEQFSSFVSIAGDNVLLLEIAGSLRLFGGLKSLRWQISAGLERRGFAASLAIARTPLAATWLARGERRVCVRDPGNLPAALRPLPLACLDWPPATIESLNGMGVTTVGDCLRLPREGFARRFGAGRLLELDRAVGRLPDPRSAWRAPEHFCADYEMTEEQADRELLLAVCQELLVAHEQFLRARQLGTQKLCFSFYHLRAPATTLSIGRAQADRSAKRWTDLLGIRFERIQLPEPVIAVRLQGGRAQAIEAGSARLAFDGRSEACEAYSMTQLAERLATRIGETSVSSVMTVAEHRPQFAWRSHSLLSDRHGDTMPCIPHAVERPLWMLPEPKPLPVEQGWPLHLGRLTLLDGPERIETGWWDEHGIARDYYTAVNPRGMRLWVYRDHGKGASWYLHGIFG